MSREAKVINAVCKNKDIHTLFSEDVDDLFTSHGDIWKALKDYYYKFKAVPDIEVLQEKFSDLDVISISGDTKFYLEDLRAEFIEGKIRQMILGAGQKLGTESPERILGSLQGDLAGLNRYTTSIKDLDITDYDAAIKHYDSLRMRSDAKGGTPGIKTGFKSIDMAYPTGMAPGHLIVVIGWPGKGKTWMTGKIAVNAWRQGYKVMIISLEMSAANMRDRLYTIMGEGRFRADDLARGYVNIDDFRAYAKKEMDDSNKIIVVSPEGLSDMTPNIVQGKIDIHRPDLVIVDYHQLFMDNKRTDAMTPRAMNLSRELKMLAVSNQIPIIDITAATAEDQSDRDDPPMLSQVAWSRAIEYDADMAMAVHRTEGTNIIEVVSRKNRHGTEFDMFLEWDLGTGEVRETFEQ